MAPVEEGLRARTGARGAVGPGAMLAILVSAFALSHAFRTLPAIVVGQIGDEFRVSSGGLGLFAASFHLAFAAMQIPVGVALDRWGPRRTVSALFVLAVLGSTLAAAAPNFAVLVGAQALVGIGCSPALMGAMVFVGRRYPAERFAAVSSVVVAAGSLGMLATATPLAYLVQHGSWRAAFALLAALSAFSAAACWWRVSDEPTGRSGPIRRESLRQAVQGLARVVLRREAAGILVLGLVTYAVPITLRSLWIVPLFVERHGFGLVATGHVVLALSLAMALGPLVFGRLDPGGEGRRRWIVATAFATSALLVVLGSAPSGGPAFDVVLVVGFGLVSSFYVLQFADVRSSYDLAVVGRALAALNMAIFLGVAAVQWSSGIVAESAASFGFEPVPVVLCYLALLLATGSAAFALLPNVSRGSREPA